MPAPPHGVRLLYNDPIVLCGGLESLTPFSNQIRQKNCFGLDRFRLLSMLRNVKNLAGSRFRLPHFYGHFYLGRPPGRSETHGINSHTLVAIAAVSVGLLVCLVTMFQQCWIHHSTKGTCVQHQIKSSASMLE